MEKIDQGTFTNLLRRAYSIDRFRVTPGLNFKGSIHFSFCGCLLSTLMYGVLLATLIWRLFEMKNDPISTTSIESGKMSDVLNISSFQFCRSNIYGNITNPVDYIRVYRENQTNLPLQTCEEEKKGFQCFCFANTTLSTTEYIHATVNQELMRQESSAASQNGDTILYSLNFKTYEYKPKDLSNPVETMWFKLEMLDDQLTGSTIYHFNKLVFVIEEGFLLHSNKKYEGVSVAYVQDFYQQTSDLYKRITFSFEGEVITTTRSFKKILDIFAAVGGFYGSITLVITLLFTQYFNFKYHENMINNINRLKRLEEHKKKSDLDLENGQKDFQTADGDEYKEIRLTYFEYLYKTICGNSQGKKIGEQYANKISEFDNLNKQTKEIENELEVCNLLLRIRKLEEVLMENKIFMQRHTERLNCYCRKQ